VSSTRWLVLNQSQSPHFQGLLERLAEDIGPSRLLTGRPFPAGDALEVVEGPSYDRGSMAGRVRSWLRFSAAAAAELARVDADGLLVVTNPPFLPNLARMWHRRTGRPYALLVWDIYPDHVVQMGWAGASNPMVRVWGHRMRSALEHAASVITIGDRMADVLRGQMRTGHDRVHVVPNFADVHVYTPEGPDLREPLGLGDDRVVMYSGNLGGSHGLGRLADIAAATPVDAGIRYVIVGDGLGRAALEARTRGLPHVEFVDRQPWELLPQLLRTADLGVVSQDASSAALSTPSKTYPLLASGVPVLALTNEGSDLAAVVEEGGGHLVPHGWSAQRAADAIREWLDGADGAARRQAARDLAVSTYSEEAVTAAMRKALRAVFP